MTRRARTLALLGSSVVVLTACGASADKFARAAEKFIEGDKVAEWGEQTFTNAVCAEPASTDVDTEFQCTADGADSHSYIFQVAIVGERKFRVESLQPQS